MEEITNQVAATNSTQTNATTDPAAPAITGVSHGQDSLPNKTLQKSWFKLSVKHWLVIMLVFLTLVAVTSLLALHVLHKANTSTITAMPVPPAIP